ncbi:hypothetical protein GCM10009527_094900 [Actinomadura nitritigenes]
MTLHQFERGIRPGTLGPGDPAQYDYLTIKSFFAGVKPGDLEGLQQAYTTLQNALQDLERRLGQHTRRLNEIWSGDAQQSGTAEIKQLAENAAAIAKAGGQFGTAMSSGAAALRTPPPIPAPTGPGGVVPGLLGEAAASPADTKAAQEALAKTNTSLASAFDQIPARLALGLPPDSKGGTPYLGAGGGRAPGGVPAAGAPGASTGLPGVSAPTPDGETNATGSTPTSAPEHSSGPRTIGAPSQGPGTSLPAPSHSGTPTDLAGSGPGFSQHPGTAPDSPGVKTPHQDSHTVPGLGRVPPAVGGAPWPPAGTGSPPVASPPSAGRENPRLPLFSEPDPQGGQPALEAPNRMSSRGVIGGNEYRGLGSVGQRHTLPSSAIEGPGQVPSRGVLRNGVLQPANEGAAGNGLPMAGGVGLSGRNGERARDVYVAEDNSLWEDETEFSPRVIGKYDQTTRNATHGS